MQKNKGAWSWIFSVFSNKSLKIQEIMKLSHKKLKEAFSNGRKKGGFSFTNFQSFPIIFFFYLLQFKKIYSVHILTKQNFFFLTFQLQPQFFQ